MKTCMITLAKNIFHWSKPIVSEAYFVVINDKHSDQVPVQSGVPLGSVLGHTLFLIYINDLHEVAEKVVQIFADDTKTYNVVNVDHEKLNKIANKFSKRSHTWDLQFHANKCKRIN